MPRIPNKNLQKMVRLQSLKGNLDVLIGMVDVPAADFCSHARYMSWGPARWTPGSSFRGEITPIRYL